MLFSLGVAVLQRWLQEHSAECSVRLRRITECQKSLEPANISVDESTIRNTINKNSAHGRTPRKKPLLAKVNIAARLKFAKEHLDVPQRYWQNILWIDETKVVLFGRNKTVKYGGGSIMVWGCLAASGLGQLAIIDLKMYSLVYQDILQENVRLSVRQWKLNRS